MTLEDFAIKHNMSNKKMWKFCTLGLPYWRDGDHIYINEVAGDLWLWDVFNNHD